MSRPDSIVIAVDGVARAGGGAAMAHAARTTWRTNGATFESPPVTPTHLAILAHSAPTASDATTHNAWRPSDSGASTELE